MTSSDGHCLLSVDGPDCNYICHGELLPTKPSEYPVFLYIRGTKIKTNSVVSSAESLYRCFHSIYRVGYAQTSYCSGAF